MHILWLDFGGPGLGIRMGSLQTEAHPEPQRPYAEFRLKPLTLLPLPVSLPTYSKG